MLERKIIILISVIAIISVVLNVTQLKMYQQLEKQQQYHNSTIENHILSNIGMAIKRFEGKIGLSNDKEYGLTELIVSAEMVGLIDSNQNSVFRNFSLEIALNNIVSNVFQANEYTQEINDLKKIYQYLNKNTTAPYGDKDEYEDVTKEEYENVIKKYMP
ncbi:hypothetical protein CIB95_03700 [Lottiidibacillus patelloidae]|uniref:Uncharacterized protein n=1 Tax=Lottiidibacillus patelloidae TaxID=2670334 RepID=A0A263BY94_9BACI|nr:hypothetical protein CIB95_03700 [Lottiidibacillus patelloidae]